MREKPYKKRPGDLEIRLLKDGRVVLIGPDQALIEVVQGLNGPATDAETERTGHGSQSASTDPSSK